MREWLTENGIWCSNINSLAFGNQLLDIKYLIKVTPPLTFLLIFYFYVREHWNDDTLLKAKQLYLNNAFHTQTHVFYIILHLKAFENKTKDTY